MKRVIKGVLFDLDDTLYDCTGTFSAMGISSAKAAMLERGLDPKYISVIDELFKTTSYSEITKSLRNEIAEEILRAGYNAYNNVDITGIRPFPDVLPTLKKLKEYNVKTGLVTTGMSEAQARKIDELGLRPCLDRVYIISDFDASKTKKDCFNEFIVEYTFLPSEVMVVGDKISNEIRYGNELGMYTVQMLHGRHANRSPRMCSEIPCEKVKNISEIFELIEMMF